MSRPTTTLEQPVPTVNFRGPHIGIVAAIVVILFLASLFPVTALGGTPYFPPPTASVAEMTAFFSTRQPAVLLCAFFQFGSAIALGIFAASAVSQLRFQRVRAARTQIALFGGFLTAANIMASACILWATTYTEVAHDAALTQALYRISFGLGGPGFSVPFGILIAGISVTAGFYRLLPRWVVVMGIVVAIVGELSWFEIVNIRLLPLIPLTRFPGFVWIVAAGFLMPRRRAARAS